MTKPFRSNFHDFVAACLPLVTSNNHEVFNVKLMQVCNGGTVPELLGATSGQLTFQFILAHSNVRPLKHPMKWSIFLSNLMRWTYVMMIKDHRFFTMNLNRHWKNWRIRKQQGRWHTSRIVKALSLVDSFSHKWASSWTV